MTKKQAVEIFKQEYTSFLKKHRDDVVMKREAFNAFIDYLHRDSQITDKQVNNWSNPF